MIYLVIAYLIGAIPTGYLIARLQGIADIRQHGSGNIGATNVARLLGVKFFFLIFMLDALKSYGCLVGVSYYVSLLDPSVSEPACFWAAAALLIGNGYSVFLNGSGGKGVATSAGILLALFPMLVALLLGIWLVLLAITRTVGIASSGGLLAAPFIAWHTVYDSYGLVLIVFMSVWGLWMHRKNIAVYLSGIKIIG